MITKNSLNLKSGYFRSAFSNKWAEKKDGKFIYRKPNISPHLFNIILRFIYSVDELNIQQLISHIQGYLVKHQAKFLYQKPTGILETIHQHESFTDLWNFCLETIFPNTKLKTSITPSRKPNLNFEIDSTLIQSNHIPLFASWIDRKGSSHYNNKNIPYDFKLLYHSGRDGFNAASFHRKYGKNISTAKLGYVNDPDSAIYCVDSQGPQMGVLICQDDNKWVNYDDNATCYPDIGIPNTSDIPNFKVEYYEVFQVIKK
ncbi:BTB/POZ protein [Rhizophagus irregularis DAOM 181602=DAOM 197198]|nr:BTB/POZ protein [Rhizophagus irregularis DAOM 181602=DAOM 197198]